MKLTSTSIVPLIIVVLSIADGAEAAGPVPPPDAKPIAVEQLYKVYRDKTWVWQDGGGFFAGDGRFVALSGRGGAASFAEGRWWVVGVTGDVCFQATWHSAKGVGTHLTCFAHRAIGDVIYQKREPSGAWYLFKNSPENPGDEFQRLKVGDSITENMKQVKARIVKE